MRIFFEADPCNKSPHLGIPGGFLVPLDGGVRVGNASLALSKGALSDSAQAAFPAGKSLALITVTYPERSAPNTAGKILFFFSCLATSSSQKRPARSLPMQQERMNN